MTDTLKDLEAILAKKDTEIEALRNEIMQLSPGTFCKGRNCIAFNGVGHSADCIQDHNACYDGID
jgi:hypothetical protein